jgi:hypothetical protein
MRPPVLMVACLIVAGCADPAATGAPLMPVVTHLIMSPDSAVVEAGDTVRYRAVAMKWGTEAHVLIRWRSSDTAVASVSSGLVTGRGAGTALITAVANDVAQSRQVRVYPATETLVVPDSIDLLPGWAAYFPVAKKGADGVIRPLTEPFPSYVADSTIASDGRNGFIQGRRVGVTTITVTAGGLTAETKVVVQPRPVGLTVAYRTSLASARHRIEAWRLDGDAGPVVTFRVSDVESVTLHSLNDGLDWSADGSRLLYSCGSDRICFPGSDSSLQVLTVQEGAHAPSWQPDGTVIFSTASGKVRSEYPDAHETPPQPGIGEAAWHVRRSSTGTLAYSCLAEDPFYPWSDSSICVLDGDDRRLEGGCGSHPDWSPDGTRIASVCGAVIIRTLSTGASSSFRIPGTPALSVRWSPDGTSLAVIAMGQLWIASLDGSNLIRAPGGPYFTAVAWQSLTP